MQSRSFHQTAVRREKDDDRIGSNTGGNSSSTFSDLLTKEMRGLNLAIGEQELQELRAQFNALSPDDQEMYREALSQEVFEGLIEKLPKDVKKEVKQFNAKEEETVSSPEEIARVTAEMGAEVSKSIAAYERDKPHVQKEKKKLPKPSFWDYGEEKETSRIATSDDYQGDDLNELGHAELEQHRELRQYARIAVWEMPLLSSTCETLSP